MAADDAQKVHARYSQVERRDWDDLAGLTPPPPSGVTLWFYLQTSPFLGILPGLLQASEEALAGHLGWSLADFRTAFAELEKLGRARADWRARVVILPTVIDKMFARKTPESPNVIRGWRAQWVEVPECPLKAGYLRGMAHVAESLSGGFRKAFLEVFADPSAKTSRKPFGEAFGELAEASRNQDQGSGTGSDTHTAGARSTVLPPPPSDAPPPLAVAPSEPPPPLPPPPVGVKLPEGFETWGRFAEALAADGNDYAAQMLDKTRSSSPTLTTPQRQTLVGIFERGQARPTRRNDREPPIAPDDAAWVAKRWRDARKDRKLEAPVDPPTFQLATFWQRCVAAAATAAEQADGGWSPTARVVAAWMIRSYLRDPNDRAGGISDQGYPFSLLTADRMNCYGLPTERDTKRREAKQAATPTEDAAPVPAAPPPSRHDPELARQRSANLKQAALAGLALIGASVAATPAVPPSAPRLELLPDEAP